MMSKTKWIDIPKDLIMNKNKSKNEATHKTQSNYHKEQEQTMQL